MKVNLSILKLWVQWKLKRTFGHFFYCYAHELPYLNNTYVVSRDISVITILENIFFCCWTIQKAYYTTHILYIFMILIFFFSFHKGWKFLPSHRTSWPQINDQPCWRQFVGAFLADRNRMCPRFFRRPWCLLAYENDGIR